MRAPTPDHERKIGDNSVFNNREQNSRIETAVPLTAGQIEALFVHYFPAYVDFVFLLILAPGYLYVWEKPSKRTI